MNKNKIMTTVKNYALVLMIPLAIYLLVLLIIPERVGNIGAILSILTLSVLPTITSYGVYFGFVSGIIDFSVGSRIIFSGMCACIGGYCFGFPGMLIGAVVSSVLMAAFVGGVFAALKIPSIIVSFGTLMIIEILGKYLVTYMNGINTEIVTSTYFRMPDALTFLGRAPYNYIFLIVVTVLFEFLRSRTKLANQANVVGSNELIARSVGIKPMRVKFGTFLLGSLFIALAAIQSACYSSAVGYKASMASSSMVFKPMMAVIIGLALSGNVRSSIGIFVGSLSISIIFTGIIALGWSDAVQNVILGFFMLLVMGLPTIRQFFADRNRRKLARAEMEKAV